MPYSDRMHLRIDESQSAERVGYLKFGNIRKSGKHMPNKLLHIFR